MKSLSLCLMIFIMSLNVSFAAETKFTKTYGIHLFFNEQEFIDVLTLSQSEDGLLSGEMHVPQDFDGKISNIGLNGRAISFDLLVPKNAGRPNDMVFHYFGTFFDETRNQLTGFVYADDSKEFIASFVGFDRH